jgi:hypothetical protein
LSEKTEWEVEQLKISNKEINKKLDNHAVSIRDFETFKVSTIEKLLQIFSAIEVIKESDAWIKRTFTKTLITAIIGAVVSLVVWAIQN